MNCEAFDSDIQLTLQQYGPLGVEVKLISVQDRATPTPPGDWIAVTVGVAPVVPNQVWRADTWHYGGVLSTSAGPLPLGVRFIDAARLIGACAAAQKLPDGFPVKEAACDLYWPLVPGVDEPAYHFHAVDEYVSVGAYTGTASPAAEAPQDKPRRGRG